MRPSTHEVLSSSSSCQGWLLPGVLSPWCCRTASSFLMFLEAAWQQQGILGLIPGRFLVAFGLLPVCSDLASKGRFQGRFRVASGLLPVCFRVASRSRFQGRFR
eukprot:12036819-Karenia_brevis.AAC.1